MLDTCNQVDSARDVLCTSGITVYSGLSEPEDKDIDQFSLPPSSDPMHYCSSSIASSATSSVTLSSKTHSPNITAQFEDDIEVAEHSEKGVEDGIECLERDVVKDGLV